MKSIYLLLATIVISCGDGSTSLIRYGQTEYGQVTDIMGAPIASSDPVGDWDAYNKFCVPQEYCSTHYRINGYTIWTPNPPTNCQKVCLCVIRYQNTKVSSCEGCIDELCKL